MFTTSINDDDDDSDDDAGGSDDGDGDSGGQVRLNGFSGCFLFHFSLRA